MEGKYVGVSGKRIRCFTHALFLMQLLVSVMVYLLALAQTFHNS
jgi:hypothetical protein